MTLAIDVQVKVPPEGVTIRAWREITRHAFIAAGMHWHRDMLPKHFGPGAARAYPGVYKKRTSKWLARKMKISPQDIRNAMPMSAFGRRSGTEYWQAYYRALDSLIQSRGGIDYLVSTGTLKNLSRLATFRAFPSRVSVQIPGTRYTPSRVRPDSTQPWIMGELTATTKAERDELQKIVTRVMRAGVKHYLSTGTIPAAPRQGAL